MAGCQTHSDYHLPLPWREHNTFLAFYDQELEHCGPRRSASAGPSLSTKYQVAATTDQESSFRVTQFADHSMKESGFSKASCVEEKQELPSGVEGTGNGVKRGGGVRRTCLPPDEMRANARNTNSRAPIPMAVEQEPTDLYWPAVIGLSPEESSELSVVGFDKSMPAATMAPGSPVQLRNRQPKSLQCTFEAPSEANHPTGQDEGMTTAMIRHIACRYRQEHVANVLDDIGLKGKYNSIYLPLNSTKRANLGYVFVNFLSVEYFEECRELLDNQVFGESRTEKRCQVTQAHVQGYKFSKKGRRRAATGAGSSNKEPSCDMEHKDMWEDEELMSYDDLHLMSYSDA